MSVRRSPESPRLDVAHQNSLVETNFAFRPELGFECQFYPARGEWPGGDGAGFERNIGGGRYPTNARTFQRRHEGREGTEEIRPIHEAAGGTIQNRASDRVGVW